MKNIRSRINTLMYANSHYNRKKDKVRYEDIVFYPKYKLMNNLGEDVFKKLIDKNENLFVNIKDRYLTEKIVKQRIFKKKFAFQINIEALDLYIENNRNYNLNCVKIYPVFRTTPEDYYAMFNINFFIPMFMLEKTKYTEYLYYDNYLKHKEFSYNNYQKFYNIMYSEFELKHIYHVKK